MNNSQLRCSSKAKLKEKHAVDPQARVLARVGVTMLRVSLPLGAQAKNRIDVETASGACSSVVLPQGAPRGATLTLALPQNAADNDSVERVLLRTGQPPGAVALEAESVAVCASLVDGTLSTGAPEEDGEGARAAAAAAFSSPLEPAASALLSGVTNDEDAMKPLLAHVDDADKRSQVADVAAATATASAVSASAAAATASAAVSAAAAAAAPSPLEAAAEEGSPGVGGAASPPAQAMLLDLPTELLARCVALVDSLADIARIRAVAHHFCDLLPPLGEGGAAQPSVAAQALVVRADLRGYDFEARVDDRAERAEARSVPLLRHHPSLIRLLS